MDPHSAGPLSNDDTYQLVDANADANAETRSNAHADARANGAAEHGPAPAHHGFGGCTFTGQAHGGPSPSLTAFDASKTIEIAPTMVPLAPTLSTGAGANGQTAAAPTQNDRSAGTGNGTGNGSGNWTWNGTGTEPGTGSGVSGGAARLSPALESAETVAAPAAETASPPAGPAMAGHAMAGHAMAGHAMNCPATAGPETRAASPVSPAAAPAPTRAPRELKLQGGRRATRVRLAYLMQAWTVSLMVHVMVLSALAFATFSSSDAIKNIVHLDSALAGHRNGEQEPLPIYADPDNVPRDKTIGDETAEDPREPTMAVMNDAAGGGGEDGGGAIVAGGIARASSTPRVRGAGKGRINEGNSLPGVKLDGLARSPLNLLPAAPAADLGGGGKIAGDPVFDVQEIGTALDQLAREILRHLKDHKLTVVWLIDESSSMDDDKKTIVQKFDRVSSELKKHIAAGKQAAGTLNHAIVGFGQGMDYILDKPHEDLDRVTRAIQRIRTDSSGTENTMRAIRDAAQHYARFVRKDRKVMMVLATDESGDDGASVEEARQALKKLKIPLYVIGRQSLFGYPFAHHRYIDPVTKDVYHPVIRRGPETAEIEIYQWDGLYHRWDEQPSGFAPYELARLTKDSGGIYFVLPSEEFMRVRKREKAYSIAQLKEYLPEYDNRMTYIEKRNASPMRQTLHAIVVEGEKYLYRREFSTDVGELVTQAREEGPKATLRLNALLAIQKRLESLLKIRDREPEKRWQAHFDLMRAQTVAFQVKAYEYRALMASIVSHPPRPKSAPRPDLTITWVVDHSQKPLAPTSDTAKKYAEAKKLLEQVIARHPRTPWADLAQDALNRGLSVHLNEWHHNPKYRERAKFVPKY